jgi:hypothetical protein
VRIFWNASNFTSDSEGLIRWIVRFDEKILHNLASGNGSAVLVSKLIVLWRKVLSLDSGGDNSVMKLMYIEELFELKDFPLHIKAIILIGFYRLR